MKKLLAILGTAGLAVSTSAVLVSCGGDKGGDVVIDADLKKALDQVESEYSFTTQETAEKTAEELLSVKTSAIKVEGVTLSIAAKRAGSDAKDSSTFVVTATKEVNHESFAVVTATKDVKVITNSDAEEGPEDPTKEKFSEIFVVSEFENVRVKKYNVDPKNDAPGVMMDIWNYSIFDNDANKRSAEKLLKSFRNVTLPFQAWAQYGEESFKENNINTLEQLEDINLNFNEEISLNFKLNFNEMDKYMGDDQTNNDALKILKDNLIDSSEVEFRIKSWVFE